MGEEVKKISFQRVMEVIADQMNNGAAGNIVFGENTFPHKFHVEISDEGEKIILEELDNKVMKYVSENRVIDAVLKYIDAYPRQTHKNYKIDHDKAKKIFKFWRAITKPFPEVIHPILQKDTPGYTFHRLDFNMEERPTEIFDYLVDGLDTNKEAFLAYLGSLFDPRKTLQQYLWISGNGGDGKGAIFRLLARIFAQSYVSVTTEARHIDKHWQSKLVGKRLAVCGDTKNLEFINSSIFMQVTGGDHVTVRPMYKAEYTTHLNTMFIFGANADPAITTEDSGKRRAIICRLDRGEYQHFDNFEERIWEERGGILFKCWEAWKKVRDKPRIPVDEESLQRLGEDTEEYWQYLLERYFEVGRNLEVSSVDVQKCLNLERKNLTNQEKGAWKRWLKRVHGIGSVQRKEGGRNIKVYVGMCERGKNESDGLSY
jgi:ribosomal protein S6E (S10)